jgi:transposase
MTNTHTHKHYDLARRAHCGTSFSPEKRAESYCASFDNAIAELHKLGVAQHKIDKYEALVVAHLQSKSRCLSTMIAGGSNFPVRRAEKANRVERARSLELTEYFNKIVNEAKKEAYYTKHPEERPILSSDENAIERLQAKLEAAKRYHAQLKEVKALIKKGVSNAEACTSVGLENPVHWHSFNIQYANKAVKELEVKIANLTAVKAKPSTESTINGVRVVENNEAMRLQVFFEGKPAADIIKLMKSHAFKWAPSVGAWQRQLTNNAKHAFNAFILPELKG